MAELEGIVIFEQRRRVSIDRARLWAFLVDVPLMGLCIPGVSQVRATGSGRYEGVLAVRLGFMTFNLGVTLTIENMDRERWHAAMRASGSDFRLGGAVGIAFQMQLNAASPGITDLVITSDPPALGAMGQFGEPLVRRKAESIFDEFVVNVERAHVTQKDRLTRPL